MSPQRREDAFTCTLVNGVEIHESWKNQYYRFVPKEMRADSRCFTSHHLMRCQYTVRTRDSSCTGTVIWYYINMWNEFGIRRCSLLSCMECLCNVTAASSPVMLNEPLLVNSLSLVSALVFGFFLSIYFPINFPFSALINPPLSRFLALLLFPVKQQEVCHKPLWH